MSTETDLSNCFRDIEPLFFSLSLILPLSFHFCFFHSLSLFLSTYPILSYPHPTYHEERLHLILAPFLFFSFSAISSLSPHFTLFIHFFHFLSQSLLQSRRTVLLFPLSVFTSLSSYVSLSLFFNFLIYPSPTGSCSIQDTAVVPRECATKHACGCCPSSSIRIIVLTDSSIVGPCKEKKMKKKLKIYDFYMRHKI